MFGSLQEGQYTLTATNTVTGCDNSKIVTISQQDIPVFVLTANSTPQDICGFDGSISVAQVSLDGVTPDALGNYTYRWFEDDPNNAPLAPTAVTLNIGNHPTIEAGVFYVKAVRNSPQVFPNIGSGCESAPFRVEILDTHVDPVATLTPSFNTSCNPAVFEGNIEVDVTTASGPGVGAQYTYNWVSTGATTPGNSINQSGVSNMFPALQDAQYTLTVTNQVTNCTDDAVATILQQDTPVDIVTTTKTDQDVCMPDGSITVTGVELDGIPDAIGSYTFRWFEGDPNNPALAPMVATLNVGNHPTIGAGSYFVKAVRNSPMALGSGCESPVLRVDIDDVHVDPLTVLTPSFNTSCDPAVFEGSIEVDVADPAGPGVGAQYTYAWVSTGATTPVGAPNNSGVNNMFTGLDDASYTLTVTNQVTQCTDQAVTTIDQQAIAITILSTTKTDQDICAPDGSVTVTSVGRTGASPDAIGNYTFRWFEGDPNNPVLAPTGTTLNAGNHPTIGAGSYFVKAVRNSPLAPGSGCESPPVRVDIDDVHVDPVIVLTPSVNTSCDPAVFEGAIEVDVSDPSGPGVGQLYSYSWVSTGSSTPAPSAGNTGASNMFTALDDGDYTLTAQNALTQCTSTKQTTIINTPTPVFILNVSSTDQALCYPDGDITVTAVSPNAVGNYTFEWYLNDPNTAPLTDALLAPITGPVLQSPQYPTMGAGTYYVKGIKSNLAPGAGCETPPFRVEIQDVSTDPVVASTITSNTSCNNAKANAVVVADASEAGGFNGDTYSFSWTLNGGPLVPPAVQTDLSNRSTVSQTLDGAYVVTVTNVSGTGCITTRSVDVAIDLSKSFPNLVTVATNDPLDCLPSGDATVTSVSIAGGPPVTGAGLAFPNFVYQWYDGNLSNQIAGQSDFQLTNLLDPGDYLVIVEDANTDCPSAPTQFTITDNSIVYPVVTMSQTAQQVACNAVIGTAALTALADGQPANATYNFDWYNSLDLSGPELFPTNTNLADSLDAGDYSVEVTNNVTGCTASFFYVIRDESPLFTPSVALTGMPRTLCVGQDGAVLARVTNITGAYPFTPDFTADMWNGSNPNLANPPDFPAIPNVPGFLINFEQTSLQEGFYTVRMTDNNTGCVSTDVVEVEDDRTPPVVTVIQENPLTNCDPTRANGQLTSSADGGKTFGYTFGWHVGTTITNPAAPVQTTNKLIGAQAGSYMVRVTNALTGCFADAPGTITDETVIPPVPDAEVVRDRTSCLVPNGWVTVSVGGQTLGYSFAWYDGASAKPVSDFDGVDYIDRDIGPYTAIATDLVTGCVSPPATVTVEDARVFPEVAFLVTPSYCLKPSGTIELTVTTPDVVLDNISWSSPPGGLQVGIGSGIYDVPAAFYEATLTTSEGCVSSAQVEVPTEILGYNGVSANGDGLNDVFEIDCINFFPNNNVKIYNRSGVLVYEAFGYNNQDVVFRGVGEMGVYLAGTELPDGTYFYIIDKRDGSKPIAGYLELIR
jgi:hypothetical protein